MALIAVSLSDPEISPGVLEFEESIEILDSKTTHASLV
jgi:hypothetical protein